MKKTPDPTLSMTDVLPRPLDALQTFLIEVGEDISSTAFQSMLAVTAEAVTRILEAEKTALQAAISLAQQERLKYLVEEMETAQRLLLQELTASGRKLMVLSNHHTTLPVEMDEERSWWFALSEAISQLEESIRWIHSLTQSQPEETATRKLGELVETLFQHHLEQLSQEAERWMS